MDKATDGDREIEEKLQHLHELEAKEFIETISKMDYGDHIKALANLIKLARSTDRNADIQICADALSANLRKKQADDSIKSMGELQRIAKESINSIGRLRWHIKKFNRTSSIYSVVIIVLTVVMAVLTYQTLTRSAEITSLIELLKKFLGE